MAKLSSDFCFEDALNDDGVREDDDNDEFGVSEAIGANVDEANGPVLGCIGFACLAVTNEVFPPNVDEEHECGENDVNDLPEPEDVPRQRTDSLRKTFSSKPFKEFEFEFCRKSELKFDLDSKRLEKEEGNELGKLEGRNEKEEERGET